jgi:rare lipoprotein A (peptidoglycan hydrolase)
MSHTRITRRRVATGILIAFLIVGTATAAGAHPSVAKWWQYDTSTWHHTWKDYAKFRYRNHRWIRHHPNATRADVRAKHRRLRDHYRGSHFHRALGWQQGQASWYDGSGLRGACGQPLVGLYAASKTLPCGSLVSVRSNGRYVLVHILDRGPYVSGRIIDLSPTAFQRLAPLGAGVIGVRVVHLTHS